MRKVLEIGSGKISFGDDHWLYVEDGDGNRVSVWLSQDDPAAIAAFFQAFAAMALLENEK